MRRDCCMYCGGIITDSNKMLHYNRECLSSTTGTEIGRKDDEGKLRWDLVPMDIWEHILWLNKEFVTEPATYYQKIKLAAQNDWTLLAAVLLDEMDNMNDVVKVYTEGARIYGDNNWQCVENANERYFAALMRHIDSDEIVNEKDFGLPHVAHAIWNCIALDWFTKEAPSLRLAHSAEGK